jgi:hypothetical protein
MVVQRRKRGDSSSPTSSIEEGHSSSDDSEADSKHRADDHEPFVITVYKVCRGLTVLIIVGSLFIVSFSPRPSLKPITLREAKMLEMAAQQKPDHVEVVMEEEEGLDELPPMELNPDIAKHDAFGVAQQYLKNYTSSFMKQAQQLQADFSSLYGGIRPSRHLLENTLHEFGGDAWVRLLQRKQNDVLHMVIIGQATAAGYGNLHKQAFSFDLQEIVEKVMSLFKIDFRVTNVAMEHMATFPYLWCVPEFVASTEPKDDVSIDIVYLDLGLSMTALELELILRQVLGLADPSPLLILRDSKDDEDRIELLQHYIEGGVLQSPVLMEWKDAVEPFLQVKATRRPPGFLDWTQWGVAESPRKKAYWTVSQHKMVAWVLAMFFLKQLELLVATEAGFYQLEDEQVGELHSPILVQASSLKEPWSKYLYFSSLSRTCLTSFYPARNLHPSRGSTTEDVHLEHPKGMVFYSSGWVLDLENAERKEKLRSQHHGFQDMVTSYHGIPASGTLTFDFDVGTSSDLILCEAQTQSQANANACKLDQDVAFLVNDQTVRTVRRITNDAISYQGQQHCYLVEFENAASGHVQLGISVVNNQVTLANGPCSISHIIWQDADA